MDLILEKLAKARDEGAILSSAYENCAKWLDSKLFEPWVIQSITELVKEKHWQEINDRFYQTLSFGTGGLRGRTIGRVVTVAERGDCPEKGPPKHPAAGSNCMNDFNVRRATMGLTNYVRKTRAAHGAPFLVFAHDTRFFSRRFAELAAHTVIEMGGKASVFESERSTPELSFALRQLGADAGVVVTASHNPPHDNGYKVYFADGAQVVEPHASGIIREVNAVDPAPCAAAGSSKQTFPGGFGAIGVEIDQPYSRKVLSMVLEGEVVRANSSRLKIVYSPLHGTGAKMVPSCLKQLGFQVLPVAEQMKPDGGFPTVKSPNPENAEALTLSLQLADKEGADLVLATDPDGDRMGVAVRNGMGKMELLNGNQIGSLLAFYRLERLFEQGILNPSNRQRARLIKTVVTTDLQKAIAQKFQVQIPETLTGFKYIGEKLQKYEDRLFKETGMDRTAYLKLNETEKRDLLLKHSAYYVFGGEESFGYSASDFTRDKDANSACVMFAEMAAFNHSRGKTVWDYLQGIYAEFGYYREKLGQLVYEGAEGARQIRNILKSLEEKPPREIAGLKVVGVKDHGREEIRDCEGDLLPREKLMFIELENGARFGVRGSGTEPKIKFYIFAHEKPRLGSRFSDSDLVAVQEKITRFLDSLWKEIEKDARARA